MARWLVPALGLACAQGWLPLVSACAAVYRDGGDLGFILGPLWPGYALGCLGMLVALGARPVGGGRRVLVSDLAALAAALLGAMLLIVSHSMAELVGGTPVALLAFAGCALMGAGSAVLGVLWGERIAVRCAGKPALLVAVAVSCAAAVCALIGLFSLMGHTVWSPMLNVVAMLCSFAGLRWTAPKEQGPVCGAEAGGAARGDAGLPIRVLVGCLTLGFSTFVMAGQFLGAQFARALDATWLFGFAGVAATVAVMAVVRRASGRWAPEAACWTAAALIVVAFYPMDAGSEFSLWFAMAGSACAMGAELVAVPLAVGSHAGVFSDCEGGRCGNDAGVCGRIDAQALLAFGTGAALGGPLGYAVAGSSLQGQFVLVSAIVAMVAGFVSLVLLMRPNALQGGGARGEGDVAAGSDVVVGAAESAVVVRPDEWLEARCGELAKACGLTPREAQVLDVLARGYDVARVQDDLGVSEGTALTHKRHVYQKLGVHTRSELLDLVNGKNGVALREA